MADERPIHQDDELPAWLRGHIQPEPDQESRPRPDAQADSASAEDIAAAFGESAAPTPTPGPAEETPPWDTDEGADVDLPAAKELKGLTGKLPWLTDIMSAQGTPDAPPTGEPDSEVLDWLAAEEPAADEPGTTPGLLTGLSGDLPWLDEVRACGRVLRCGRRSIWQPGRGRPRLADGWRARRRAAHCDRTPICRTVDPALAARYPLRDACLRPGRSRSGHAGLAHALKRRAAGRAGARLDGRRR